MALLGSYCGLRGRRGGRGGRSMRRVGKCGFETNVVVVDVLLD